MSGESGRLRSKWRGAEWRSIPDARQGRHPVSPIRPTLSGVKPPARAPSGHNPFWAGAGGPILAAVVAGVFGLVGLLVGNSGAASKVLPGSPEVTRTVTAPPVTVTATSNAPTGSRTASGDWHSGSLTIALSGSADLDAPQSDPTWGEVSLPNGANYDLSFTGEVLNPQFGAQFQVQILSTGSTNPPSCQTESGYGTGGVDMTTLKIGTYLCAVTSEGRFAQLRLAKFPGVNQPVTFDVIVFNKSGG